jgi:hypothetical protein
MTPSGSSGATSGRAEDATVDTFTIRLPRWPILLRLLGRDPLVRATDRIEALVVVLAVAVTLLAAPVIAAVGTAVYDSSRQHYVEQAQTRHTVTATVTDVPTPQRISRAGATAVDVRWIAADTEHAGTLEIPSAADIGDSLEIWVGDDGEVVPQPTPTTRAATEAAVGALGIWFSVAVIATALIVATRAVCDRIRFAGWQRGLDSLVDNGDGHQHPGRTSER